MNYAQAIGAFAALLDDEAAPQAGLTHAARMRHYRANCRINRVHALRASFATVHALVGAEFFDALAAHYVTQTPADSANLHALGADFAGFIAGFAPAGELPYLADVARMDWALWCAALADDAVSVPVSALAEMPPDTFGEQGVRFVPAFALVASNDWPLADLLAMHQGGAAADLGAGGQALCALREQWWQLAPARWQLYQALMQGQSVADALQQAHEHDAAAPLGEWLGWLFANGAISAVYPSGAT